MLIDYQDRFIYLFIVGVSLLLLGGCHLLLARASLACRIAASVFVISAVMASSVGIFETSNIIPNCLAILLPVITLYHISGSVWLRSATRASLQFVAQPYVRSTGLVTAGLAIVIGAGLSYDQSDEQEADRSMQEMQVLMYRPATSPDTTLRATSDQGRRISLHKPTEPRTSEDVERDESQFLATSTRSGQFVHTQVADDHANCHGWVFTGGRAWIGGDEVESILDENGYEQVCEPRLDDLVVYRHNDKIIHTAIVRAAAPNQQVLVEGKWGWLGLYIHPVEQSYYGSEFSYYRSARNGHLLKGLTTPVSTVPKAPRLRFH